MTLVAVLIAGTYAHAGAQAPTSQHAKPVSRLSEQTSVVETIEAWCTANGLPIVDGLPFDFACDGMPAQAFVQRCRVESTQAGPSGASVLRLADTASGLWIEIHAQRYPGFDAVDWVCVIGNDADGDSPVLDQFMPLNGEILTSFAEDNVTLRWSNGDSNIRESFLPHDDPLPVSTARRFTPVGGRSSNGTFPFFNVAGAEGGSVLAVGWTGQWLVEFQRDDDGAIHARAGMERTHFRLHPGERVRTPRVVLLRWAGTSMEAGHNRFRQLMRAHYTPREDDRPIPPPIAFNTAAAVYVTGTPTNIDNQKRMAEQAARVGCEAFWLDAYWYPQPWYEHVGDWFPRPEDFPNGLAPLSEKVHELGMDFVLWFEPERVVAGTRWAERYGALQLTLDDNPDRLMNLGDPEARRAVTDFLDARIKEWGVDIYRQDFNMDTLETWRAHDDKDRQGVTEMKYVEGLYALWDELVARNPGLRIDNCASGGRRIDIETCRRAWPLWRSDFNDIGEGLKGPEYFPMMGCADQIHVAGLSLYIPFHTGPVWASKPYVWRSAMAAGIALYGRIDDFDSEMTRQAVDELRRLRPCFEGDFYLLTPLSTSQRVWHAYQLHRPDLDRGCALFFRRPDCPDDTLNVRLRDIQSDSTYRVRWTGEHFDTRDVQTVRGATLQSPIVSIEDQPGSVLLEYERVSTAE